MLEAAIEKILSLAKPQIYEKDGHTFSISEENIEEIRPVVDRPGTLTVSSLDSLVKIVKTEGIKDDTPLYVTVPNHLTVSCFGQFKRDDRCSRTKYYCATEKTVPGWEEEVKLSFEDAIIALRTCFQPTQDTEYALKLLSEITTGAKITFNDNGVATSVVTRKGIDLQSNQAIRPIITLRPYRTFQEVEQPASQFLIRVNENRISFIEADGGMWKLAARKTIVEYLEKAFAEEITAGSVVVAL